MQGRSAVYAGYALHRPSSRTAQQITRSAVPSAHHQAAAAYAPLLVTGVDSHSRAATVTSSSSSLRANAPSFTPANAVEFYRGAPLRRPQQHAGGPAATPNPSTRSVAAGGYPAAGSATATLGSLPQRSSGADISSPFDL